jgi:teichuronic acid biosynthesis glycosyltransferase TuaG
MKKFPLISVIVTTYNRVELLSLTLDSILRQTYINLEVIVVSDGSTDGTDDFMGSFNDSRISYLKLEYNSGLPAVVRNLGIKNSSGEYIAFCDDDDLWDLYKLELQLIAINKFDLCFTNRRFINDSGKRIKFRSIYIPTTYSIFNLLMTNYISLSTVLVRKDVINKFIGFNENKEFKASEDYDLWARMLINKIKFCYCSENLISYRVHNSNISNNLYSGVKRVMKINRFLFLRENLTWYFFFFSFLVNSIKLTYYFLIFFRKIAYNALCKIISY